jgi:nucleotide-binding universal stress UspA family protein
MSGPGVFREILVPYDGSPLSAVAIPFAAEIARRSGGRVTLARALVEPAIVTDIPKSAVAAAKAIAQKELEAAAARAGAGVEVAAHLRIGLPVDVILAAARGKDLIAMTTHGRSGLSRWVLGSITEKLIRLSRIPLLIVRPRRASAKAASAAAARMFQDAVVPLDGSEVARNAVAPFAAAAPEGMRVHLVTVLAPSCGEADEQASADYLAHRAAALEERGLKTVTRILHHDSPAEGIGAYAEHVDAGLIVMATHGAGGLKEWVLGGVTDKVIRRGPVPVLVVPGKR